MIQAPLGAQGWDLGGGWLGADQVAVVVNHAVGFCDQPESVHEAGLIGVVDVTTKQGADCILVNPDRFAVCRDFHLLPLLFGLIAVLS